MRPLTQKFSPEKNWCVVVTEALGACRQAVLSKTADTVTSTICEGSSFLLLLSRKVTSASFRPHGLQNARLLCPPPFPGVCSNSRPLSR